MLLFYKLEQTRDHGHHHSAPTQRANTVTANTVTANLLTSKTTTRVSNVTYYYTVCRIVRFSPPRACLSRCRGAGTSSTQIHRARQV